MRRSNSRRKTVLAIVRTTLGISVEQLAKAMACSVSLIQKIEAGEKRLGDWFAESCSAATGVAIHYLLRGETGRPPVAVDGKPLTKDHFDRAQAGKLPIQNFRNVTAAINAKVSAVISRAHKAGAVPLVQFKLLSAIESAELQIAGKGAR